MHCVRNLFRINKYFEWSEFEFSMFYCMLMTIIKKSCQDHHQPPWRYLGRFTFERIHNAEEQIYFYERAENHKAMSGCLNHSKERIFQVNILVQGRIKDSWKGGSYA